MRLQIDTQAAVDTTYKPAIVLLIFLKVPIYCGRTFL